MSDENPTDAANPVSAEGVEEPRGRPTSETLRARRAALAKVLAAVLVALPGAYASIRTQSAADGTRLRTEIAVRDRQEEAIRRHVEVIRREIAAVREAAVTHRELLDVVMRLRDQVAAIARRSHRADRERVARERELERRLEALRGRAAGAARTKAAVRSARRALPKLQSSSVLRKKLDPRRED